jgi:hypothetical protein
MRLCQSVLGDTPCSWTTRGQTSISRATTACRTATCRRWRAWSMSSIWATRTRHTR